MQTIFKQAHIKLDSLETGRVAEELNASLTAMRFDPERTTILAQELSFYPDYRFLDINDYDALPPKRCFALYQPGDVVILDWTNAPIYALNERAPIALNTDNVCDYVRFFYAFVKGRKARFIVVEDIEDIHWREDPSPSVRKSVSELLQPVTLEDTAQDGTFQLSATFLYRDVIFKSRIYVRPDGHLQMTDETILLEDVPVFDDALSQ